MTKRDKPPPPIVRLSGGRITPAGQWDAELLSNYPSGAEFDLVHRSRRSTPHNGMYWAQLSQMAKATESWPSAEHAHQWVKMRLGYTTPICAPDGKPIAVVPDSTAFNAMSQAEFGAFYERFVRLVAEEMGIDLA